MMLLGWESNTSILWQNSEKLRGKLELRGGKFQVPHPLCETLEVGQEKENTGVQSWNLDVMYVYVIDFP